MNLDRFVAFGNYRDKKTVFEITEEAERPTTKLLVEASTDNGCIYLYPLPLHP